MKNHALIFAGSAAKGDAVGEIRMRTGGTASWRHAGDCDGRLCYAWIVVGIAALSWACSEKKGELADSGAPDAGVVDGGELDAGGTDSGVDGGTLDGGADDAGPDSGSCSYVYTGMNCWPPWMASCQPEGRDSGPVPVNHRPNDAQCQQIPQPGTCPFPDSTVDSCTQDADCADGGGDGRCIESPGGGPALCLCTFTGCQTDGDCPNGKTCTCNGSPYMYSEDNYCVPGNCRVDANCGDGGYCSPSGASQQPVCGPWYESLGYYCHTPNDQCVNDTDCGAPENVATNGPCVGCVYAADAGFWECVNIACPE